MVSSNNLVRLGNTVVGRNILEQALASGAKQIKIVNTSVNSSSQCIICKREFSSSVEVQRHLLADHVDTKNKDAVEQVSNTAIKQEDAEPDHDQETRLEDTGVELDEEHFSINNVEVKIKEDESASLHLPEELSDEVVVKEELDYEDMVETVDFPEEEEASTHHDKVSEKKEPKAPVDLTCPVCEVVLSSILGFTTHMKTQHKDREDEHKHFFCDICHQSFYFQSSLNSHKSKAHQETSGTTFRCPLCPSVTNSKNGMRRHLRNTHKKTLLNEELSYKCNVCGELFWSVAERTVHIAQSHKEEGENMSKCHICQHISPNRHALRRHFQRMHPNEPLMSESSEWKCDQCGKVFAQKVQLSNHAKTEHSLEKTTYQCSTCTKQFNNKVLCIL